MTKTIGFIGCGNMAQAIIGGLLESRFVKAEQIVASARTEETLWRAKEKFAIKTEEENSLIAEKADFLFVAVKPHQYEAVLREVREYVKIGSVVISIAAGVTIEQMEEWLGRDVKIIRTMPNTPSFVRKGMTAYVTNQLVTEEDRLSVHKLLESFGHAEEITEDKMDAIPAISGSSPAYAFVMMEAMADSAVLQGIPRDQAYRFAAQALIGAGEMVLQTGIHPAVLKDQVCSPGGATIEAIITLEKNGFRSAIQEAMAACTAKAIKMKSK